MIRLIAILIGFLLIHHTGNSQDQVDPIYFGAKIHKGYIWAHTSKLEDIPNDPWGVQLEWSRINIGKKAWERCNCYSKVGISLNYYNFGNPDILGSSYNLIAFAEPLLSFKSKLYYSLRTGIGATYLDQVYDIESNPTNLFYSSHISFIVLANLIVNYKIAPDWILNLSGNYNHISNGGMKKPNKGMNFPTLSLGVDYVVNPTQLEPREKIKNEKGKLKFYGRVFATRPDVAPTDQLPPGREWLLGIALGSQLNVANFNGLSLGIEFVKDNSLKEEGIRQDINEDHHYLGLVAGHHLFFGKFDFSQQIGIYMYKPFPIPDHKIYQRYELIYQLSRNLTVGTSLKTHAEVAENFDIRIGIIF